MGAETVSMFELTQAMWACFMVSVPIALAVIVARMVWRAGGLPVPETMRLLETMVEEHEHTRTRVAALENRLHKLDGVVPLRRKR